MEIHTVQKTKPLNAIIEGDEGGSPLYTVWEEHNFALVALNDEQDLDRVVLERAFPGQLNSKVREPAESEIWYPRTMEHVMHEPERFVVYRVRILSPLSGRLALRVSQ